MSDKTAPANAAPQLVQGLGRLDATMIVAGSMIGSGIFIVSADIARQVGSAGWLMVVWLFTGVLTLVGALSYGELASMMPKAGGQYVYLREAYGPLWGFLYGWTMFLVIQTGTIAAVAVAFARYLGVIWPAVSPTAWIVPPINLSANYAVSLSVQQFAAIAVIVFLSLLNTQGLKLGKWIQNIFTSAKTLALLALIAIGFVFGTRAAGFQSPGGIWSPQDPAAIVPDLSMLPSVTAATGLGLLIACCVAQSGSLFSSVAWESVTFIAGEVKEAKRTVPLSLIWGTVLVISLYLLANVAYLLLLPIPAIQHAADDRVATAAVETVFHNAGAGLMAAAILVSTFGCNNGLILTGARIYYAMARDGLFFRATARLNARHVPSAGLLLQCLWAGLLVLPRTRLRDAAGAPLLDPATHVERYGNLYSDLLDYVVFATLLFYVLTIIGVFVLRRKQPDAERPYRAWGYPWLPGLYIAGAGLIMLVLLLYRTKTTWPGMLIVLAGVPVYGIWGRKRSGGVME
ncbi:MAG: amino acid permease [Verrucomicrobiota bacterium]